MLQCAEHVIRMYSANKRPHLNIDWVIFRENTEGAYVLGSKGIELNHELAFDFKVTTRIGTERLVRMAFEFLQNNTRKKCCYCYKV